MLSRKHIIIMWSRGICHLMRIPHMSSEKSRVWKEWIIWRTLNTYLVNLNETMRGPPVNTNFCQVKHKFLLVCAPELKTLFEKKIGGRRIFLLKNLQIQNLSFQKSHFWRSMLGQLTRLGECAHWGMIHTINWYIQ